MPWWIRAVEGELVAVFDHYLRMVEDHLEDLHEVETTVGAEVPVCRRKSEP